jgi:hypothetical protein
MHNAWIHLFEDTYLAYCMDKEITDAKAMFSRLHDWFGSTCVVTWAVMPPPSNVYFVVDDIDRYRVRPAGGPGNDTAPSAESK